MPEDYYRVCRECKKTSRVGAQFCSHCGKAMPKEVEIFFSYAHRDEELLEDLITHLTILRRTGLAMLWYDQDISKGTEWKPTIFEHLDVADIILLLVSPSFIASDFSYSVELERAMERHGRNEACVIPVILRPVSWHDTPFGILQALPKNAKPIVSWGNRDEALLNVTQGIQSVLKERFLLVPVKSQKRP
jgi:hypothetical protein